jgi:hypothetical protein
MKYYVHNEELFDVIHKVHLSIGHGGVACGQFNRKGDDVFRNISNKILKLS